MVRIHLCILRFFSRQSVLLHLPHSVLTTTNFTRLGSEFGRTKSNNKPPRFKDRPARTRCAHQPSRDSPRYLSSPRVHKIPEQLTSHRVPGPALLHTLSWKVPLPHFLGQNHESTPFVTPRLSQIRDAQLSHRCSDYNCCIPCP